jgi:hypothetical protein
LIVFSRFLVRGEAYPFPICFKAHSMQATGGPGLRRAGCLPCCGVTSNATR